MRHLGNLKEDACGLCAKGAVRTQASALCICAGRHLQLLHGAAMLLAARVLLLSLVRLLIAHQWSSCQPLFPTEALLLLSLQAAWENAGLQHAMNCMMAQQAPWAASGPMHGAVPGYELGHPFHHSGEPVALNPGQGALHVLYAARTRSTLPRSPLLPASRATVSGKQSAYTSRARPAAQLLDVVAAGPGVGGMLLPMPAPGFSAPVYSAPAPGQAVSQHLRLAPNASSHRRGAGVPRPQAAMRDPMARRQQLQALVVPRRTQPGVPTPRVQPQQAGLVPVQGQPPGPRQVGAHQQQQAAVVPTQAQAQGLRHDEQEQSSDHMAAQGPSQPPRQTQQGGAAQPWEAQRLRQGSAQPTSQSRHQDRPGQGPVQASGPQQVRAAGACTVLSPTAPFGGHQHSAGQGQEQQQRAAVPQLALRPEVTLLWPLHVPSTSCQLAMSLQALTSRTSAPKCRCCARAGQLAVWKLCLGRDRTTAQLLR